MAKKDALNLRKTEKGQKDNCSRCFYWIKQNDSKGWCRQYNFPSEAGMLSDGFLESQFQEEDFENVDIIREYKNTDRSSMVEQYHPNAYIPKPTAEDYQKTLMKRYFCKYRSRERNTIVEISRDEYKKLNTQYYKLLEIEWRIDGPVTDEVKDGFLISKGIANSNRDIVNLSEKEFIGIKGYLTDFTELAYVKGKTIIDEAPAESVFGSGKVPTTRPNIVAGTVSIDQSKEPKT